MTIFKKHDIFLCYHLYNKDKNDSRSSYLKASELKELLEKQGFNCYLLDPESSVQAYKETVKEVRNSTCFLLVINNGIIEKCQNLGKDEATGEIHYSLKEDTRCHEEIEAFVKKYLTSVIAHNWAMCYCDCSQEDFSDRQISLLRDDMLFDCQNYSRDWDRLLEWAKAKKQEAEEKERLEAEKAEKKRQEEEEAKRKKEEAERKEQESSYGKTLTDAEILYFREGRESDPQNIKDLREKACDGDKDAQFQLAEYYNDGKGGVKIDKAQCEYWYKQAADNAHIEAMFKVAQITKQFEDYLKAANAGHAEAQYAVGIYYSKYKIHTYDFMYDRYGNYFYWMDRDKSPVDDVQSKEWLIKSSNQGFLNAKYILGRILKIEKSSKEDVKKGKSLIKVAYKQGNKYAVQDRVEADFLKAAKISSIILGICCIVAIVFFFTMDYTYLCLEIAEDAAIIAMTAISCFFIVFLTLLIIVFALRAKKHGVRFFDSYLIFCALIFCLALYTVLPFAVDHPQIEKTYIQYEEREDGTLAAYLTDYRKEEVVFPSEKDGKLVSEIKETKYTYSKDKVKLKKVTIPSSVTSIGNWAFSDCSSLTSITIPSGVTSIDDMAFNDCSSLTSISVDINNTVYKSDGNCIIEKSTNKLILGCKNSVIPKYVTSIGDWAFHGCSSMTSMVIPSSVTSIGSSAFSRCSSIENITVDINNAKYKSEGNCIINKATNELILGCKNSVIPNYVTSIGSSAFDGCSSLTSIEIPGSVTSIGSSAFDGCSSLTSVTFGDNSQLTSIDNWAFSGCSSLTSIELPSSVTSIGGNAFSGCSSLTSIEIPSSVTSIYYGAFYRCSNLTIYCEVESQPSGWDSGWNKLDGDDNKVPVVWGYKG